MKEIFQLKRIQEHPSEWNQILSESIVTADQLARHLPVDAGEIERVTRKYPMRINSYYMALIKEKGSSLGKQAIPDIKELEDTRHSDDPLDEERQSPAPNIIHRYPNRVLFLVSGRCALYCRFCMRKRGLGGQIAADEQTIDLGLGYIRRNFHINEVVLSGGDPLLLDDAVLEKILHRLRAIPHIEVIRIHTRTPCVLPQRISKELADLFKRFHPVYINTHFNHPDEITPEAARACTYLADAGVPLGCQTVLLKGVNDTPRTMKQLMQRLLKIRVRPYYIHHADPVRGTGHFRTPVKVGLKIMKALRGNLSGMCVPQYMIDLPGGGGKVPMLPAYHKKTAGEFLRVENYKGDIFEYPLS